MNQFPEPKFRLWLNLYFKFIEQRKLRTLPKGVRTEKHHILPKSLGGDPKGECLILSLREHYIAHMLLYQAYRNQSMACSFMLMASIKDNGSRLSSREFENLRKERNHFLRENRKGKKHSEETKKKIGLNSKLKFKG